MEVRIMITDFAVKRLTWAELKETVEREYETSQRETLRILKHARREFGLEVGDDGESSQREADQ